MVKRIPLAAKLDTAAAAPLRDDIAAARGEDLVLDGAGVEQLGALCLEVLMSAHALWTAEGRSVTIENASAQMADDLGRFGLTPDTLAECAA